MQRSHEEQWTDEKSFGAQLFEPTLFGQLRTGRIVPFELHAGLDRLKADDRATLEAFYLRGRSLKQMAREFEAPVGTIKRRLFVARQRLKEAMGGDGGEYRLDRPQKFHKPKRELAAV